MRRMDIKKRTKYIAGSTAAFALAMTSCAVGSMNGHSVSLDDREYLAGEEENVNTDTDALIKDADDLADKLSETVQIEAKDVDKDETVYAFADAQGNVDTVLVNETLKNRDGKSELVDETDLTGVVNVKGDEEFSQSGNKLTWAADGNEISYQGTTDKELPVEVKATYYLDGQEITPKDLAGQTGKVKIRFDYSCKEKVTKEVNGKDEEITVPFVAVTGMVLGDNFSNVAVENGKTIQQGESSVVVGYAMPGWADNIGDVAEDKEVTIPDYVEVTADVVDFSLDMTVTMVMNGSELNLDGGMDLSDLDEIADSLQDAGNQLASGSGELSDGAGTLAEKMGELSTGAGTLKNGVDTLAGKTGVLSNGIATLDASAQGIAAGINALDAGLGTDMSAQQKQEIAAQATATVEASMAAGTDTYNYIYNQAYSGVAGASTQIAGTINNYFYQDICRGKAANAVAASYPAAAQAYATSAATYQTAVQNYRTAVAGGDPETISNALASLDAAVADLGSKASALTTVTNTMYGAATMTYDETSEVGQGVAGGINQLSTGITTELAKNLAPTVVAACKTSASQAAAQAAISGAESTKKTIKAQIEATQANGYSLVTGANALAEGTGTLAEAVPALTAGINQLVNGTSELANGAGLLKDGADQVATGAGTLNQSLVALNNDAIQKMVETYNGDVKDLVERMQAAMEASAEYDSFAGRADGVASATKFIIKTGSITAE